MYEFLLVVFVLGYLAIALEHNIHIDKAATSLVLAGLIWATIAINFESLIEPLTNIGYKEYSLRYPEGSLMDFVTHFSLGHHLIEIGSILFFLIGAMTIVEIVDYHGGFSLITDLIKTKSKRKLLWILGLVTFFMSATLDNLTTGIVLFALLNKLIKQKELKWTYLSMVIIVANAGGAWSPIGDVTTIMLWIGGQVSAFSIIKNIFLPSVVSAVVALLLFSLTMKGTLEKVLVESNNEISRKEKFIISIMGVSALLFVPIFKSITHLPPFIGMVFGLGVLWFVTSILHLKKDINIRRKYSVNSILTKIDTTTILFFLGILLAVGGLQTTGHLSDIANQLNKLPFDDLSKIYGIGIIIGLLSAIVDNVPLVAGAMGMYPITEVGAEGYSAFFVKDGVFWEFLAYCAGTGGSVLIIGSAVGVAVMGLAKIDFMWYLRKISWIALVSYICGAFFYIIF